MIQKNSLYFRSHMKRIYLLLFLVFIVQFSNAQAWKEFKFQTGDILFQDLDCGTLCEAIETVTPAWKGKHFSHAGMIFQEGDFVYVIEAIGKDVHSTPIDKFMQRQLDSSGQPKVVVGRLKKPYKKLNTDAVNFALTKNGIAYDDAFIYNNGKYYCTELIYDAYKTANKGIALFELQPMTYKDLASDKTFPAWVDYYNELGVSIPEGQPGCNPGSIATSKKIKIVASFY